MPFCLLPSAFCLLPSAFCSPASILCPAIARQSDTQQIVAITQHPNFTCPVAVGLLKTPPVFRAIFHTVSRKISDTCRISGVGAHAPTGP